MPGAKVIFNKERHSIHLGLSRYIILIKDIKGNYWYVSTTVCKNLLLKNGETMVFSSDSKGNV